MAAMVPLHRTRWLPELKIETLQMTSSPWPMAGFQNIPPMALYQNCYNGSAWLKEIAAKAKNRKPFKRQLSAASIPFQNNFTEVFLLWQFTKIANIVQLG